MANTTQIAAMQKNLMDQYARITKSRKRKRSINNSPGSDVKNWPILPHYSRTAHNVNETLWSTMVDKELLPELKISTDFISKSKYITDDLFYAELDYILSSQIPITLDAFAETITVMVRFLNNVPPDYIELSQFQLMGICCRQLASEYEDTETYGYWVYLGATKYKNDEFLKMQYLIWSKIAYQFHVPNVYLMLNILLADDTNVTKKKLAFFCALLAMMSPSMYQWTPSVIAQTIKAEVYGENIPNLQCLVELKKNIKQFKPWVNKINRLIDRSMNHPNAAVGGRKKRKKSRKQKLT